MVKLKVCVLISLMCVTIGGVYIKSYAEDLSISVTPPSEVTGSVPNLEEIFLTGSALQNVNWDIKQKVDWNSSNDTRKKLIYKTTNDNQSINHIKEELNSSVAMGVEETVNEKALENPYIIAVYSDNGNTIAGEKGSACDTLITAIDEKEKVNGYMEVLEVPMSQATNSKNVQLQKIEGDVTIRDLPYTVKNNISISSSNSNGKRKVTITPKDSIKDIKEVGVRVEYTNGNIKKGFVKKTNLVTSNEITFSFPHIPQDATYTAYCIKYDNEEIRS